MVTEPNQRCEECGRIVIVRPDGRGFPPDIAKRQLAKQCKKAGHVSRPIYQAGIGAGLLNLLER
jgi:hypothetical protein